MEAWGGQRPGSRPMAVKVLQHSQRSAQPWAQGWPFAALLPS